MAVDLGDDALRLDLHALALELLRPLGRQVLAESREDLLAAVEQPHLGAGRVDVLEVHRQYAVRQLRDLAGDLDAGGPPADDHEAEPGLPSLGVRGESSHLERPEDARPKLERVVDRLHPGRPARELVVAEVRLPGAGGDDQAVVRDLEPHPVGAEGRDDAPFEVEPHDLRELDPRVSLPPQDVSNRRRDLALGENAGSDLVQQWLEQVVVDLVDKGHLDRGPLQQPGGEQTSEAAADDDHAMASGGPRLRRLGLFCHRSYPSSLRTPAVVRAPGRSNTMRS